MSNQKRRFLAAAVAAALTLAAQTAGAQQPAPKPSASPTSPMPTMPTLPVAPAEPSAAAIALGRELIMASGISRSLDIIVPQFLDQIGTTLTQTRPDLIRDLNDVMVKIKPEFDKQADDLVTSAGKLYAQRLTEPQLKEIVTFFKSPAGVAYVGSQPLVMNDLIPQMQAFTQRLSTDMMTRVRAEMKTRGHQL